MSFDPIEEIAAELKKKMEKILSPGPAICIITAQSEIKYMDEALENRKDYIQKYVKENFALIDVGQYTQPISKILLSFFKIAPNLMFVIYLETGKMGNLLLYRGLIESYGTVMDNLYLDIQSMEDWERNANLVLKLRNKEAAFQPSTTKKIASIKEEIHTAPNVEIATMTPTPSHEVTTIPKEYLETYPQLLDQYRDKKFNFMEGVILRHCNGDLLLDEIIAKTKFPKKGVLEVINFYQEKGWLVLLDKRGEEVVTSEIEGIPSVKKEISLESIEKIEDIVQVMAETSKKASEIYPVLLERHRNKKFNYKEGTILQFCDGQYSVDDIVAKTQITEEEVLKVISSYQKKEWLIIHDKTNFSQN